jgi:hypothetical protein
MRRHYLHSFDRIRDSKGLRQTCALFVKNGESGEVCARIRAACPAGPSQSSKQQQKCAEPESMVSFHVLHVSSCILPDTTIRIKRNRAESRDPACTVLRSSDGVQD